MISQSRSISNNEHPNKAIDYATLSKKEATFFAKEKNKDSLRQSWEEENDPSRIEGFGFHYPTA